MYIEITVVVDGAVDSEEVFTDYALAEEFIQRVERDAADDGYRTEVFKLFHEHKLGEDCECAQYKTSHLPDHVFNG